MIELSDAERDELRDTARRFLADRSPSQRVRALLDDPVGHDPVLWQAIAELGWPAIRLPERYDGMDASYSDASVILHELGRQLVPSPWLASVAVGAELLLAGDNEALAAAVVPGVAAGTIVLTAALSGTSGSYDAEGLTVAATVGSGPSGSIVLDGAARFVPDAHVADHIVVAARDGAGGVSLALVDRTAAGVAVEPEPLFDQTRRLARVTLDGVAVGDDRLLADPGRGGALHRRGVSLGAIGVVCDAVGAAERILEISTEYAKQRHQFGRPIGSFQAVKHHLANMFTDVEASRAAAAFALGTLDAGGDGEHAAAVATSFAGPACARVAALAIQVHGGIGFTWEHDAHLFLKRIRLDESLFGNARWHRRHLAAHLLDADLPTL